MRSLSCRSVEIGVCFSLAYSIGVAPAHAGPDPITYSTSIVTAGVSEGFTTPGQHPFAASFCATPSCGGVNIMSDTGPAGGGFARASVALLGVFTPSPATSSSVEAITSYGIEVLGAFGTEVPVTIASTIYATATDTEYSGATGSITVTNRQGRAVYSKNCYSSDGSCSDFASGGTMFPSYGGRVGNAGFSGPAVLLAGYQYDVTLDASASTEVATAQASVDPTFTIDPAYAANFQLIGVPSAAAAVPEPISWSMMIAGLGAVGMMMRQRASAKPHQAA